MNPHPLRAVLALARADDPPETMPEPLRSQILGTRAIARALAADLRAWLDEAPVAHAELAGVPRVTVWKDLRALERALERAMGQALDPKPTAPEEKPHV